MSNIHNRRVYDLGVDNQSFRSSDDDTSGDFSYTTHNEKFNKTAQYYYQNKYYNYQKPTDDLRNEEWDRYNEVSLWEKLSTNSIYKVLFVIGVLFAIDWNQYRKKYVFFKM